MESQITLTRAEAAKHCNISLPILDSLLHRAQDPLPHIRVGRKYLIPRAGLEKWLEEEAERQQHGHVV